MPVTVDTSDNAHATGMLTQKCLFKALGLYWLFASDGYNLVYYTSSDGEVWSPKTVVTTTNTIDEGKNFSVCHFNYLGVDYVYLTTGIDAAGYPLTFMRGVLSADGTISWEPEITVRTASPIIHYGIPDIAVCADGRLMIAYCYGTATRHATYVSHNPNNDGSGTWTHEITMAAVAVPYCLPPSITALTAGKAYVAANRVGPIRGNLWDGAAWLGEEVVDPATTLYEYFGLNNYGDTVYIVFFDDYDKICYFRYRDPVTGWSARETVSPNADCFPPKLSVDAVTGNIYGWHVKHPLYDAVLLTKRLNTTWVLPETVAVETDITIYSINCTLAWINDKCLSVWTRGELAPFYIRAHLYVPIIPIPRLTGDGLTQTIYVS